MYIEDLIHQFARSPKLFEIVSPDSEFIQSIDYQILEGKSLTSRQAYAIIKVMRKYTDCATVYVKLPSDVFEQILNARLWKTEPRVTVQKRNEARYLGDNLIAVSYHTRQEINSAATALRAVWRDGVQVISINSANIEKVIEFIGAHGFEIDDTLEQYLALCLSSKKQTTHFVADADSVVCNVCDNDVISMFLLHVVGAQLI